ncbi:acyl-CoA dehydrogenase NM domain-like protein [Pseudohyphozyma bogoriensis]|nr:acyl-CoA dehydrogenase NM domain-like protein [Pseudohyphozyma bogoriensis]
MTAFGNTSTPFAEPAWYHGVNSPYYTAKHVALRSYLRQYFDTYLPSSSCEAWEAAGQVPRAVFEQHAKEGLVAAAIFPSPGKEWLDKAGVKLPCGITAEDWDIWCDLVLADEATRSGYLGVNWGLGGGNGIGAPPLVSFGTPEQKERILVPVLRGDKRMCLGVTEPSGGSDVAGLRTTARKTSDGKHYVVNGSKKWITNAITADYMTTAVRTGGAGPGGVSVLVIPLDAKGVTRRKIENTGVNASGSTYVELEDVLVPVENLIGKEGEGFPLIMSNFLHERLILCIQANRMSRICLEDAYEYACERKTFGKALVTQPLIRAKMSDMARTISSNHAMIEAICYHIATTSREAADRDLAGLVALCKILGDDATYSAMSKDASIDLTQSILYLAGTGTRAGWLFTNLGSQWNGDVWPEILEAYKWLLEKYLPGDEVTLVGYSRGSFAMCVLAAIIDDIGFPEALRVGLEHSNDLERPSSFRMVISEYAALNTGNTVAHIPILNDLRKGRQAEVSQSGRGGEIRAPVYHKFPSTTVYHFPQVREFAGFDVQKTPKCVRTVHHALTLDETEGMFTPVVFRPRGGVEQCWFGGRHLDLGLCTGNFELGRLVLFWAADHLVETGVSLDTTRLLSTQRTPKLGKTEAAARNDLKLWRGGPNERGDSGDSRALR